MLLNSLFLFLHLSTLTNKIVIKVAHSKSHFFVSKHTLAYVYTFTCLYKWLSEFPCK